MTRKDYSAIAEAFNETYREAIGSNPHSTNAKRQQWRKDVLAVATKLKADNPRFRASRFFDACVPETGYSARIAKILDLPHSRSEILSELTSAI